MGNRHKSDAWLRETEEEELVEIPLVSIRESSASEIRKLKGAACYTLKSSEESLKVKCLVGRMEEGGLVEMLLPLMQDAWQIPLARQ